MKECCPEADSGGRTFGYSRQAKGRLTKEYEHDPTEHRAFGLVGSALLFFDNDTHALFHLQFGGFRPRLPGPIALEPLAR